MSKTPDTETVSAVARTLVDLSDVLHDIEPAEMNDAELRSLLAACAASAALAAAHLGLGSVAFEGSR